MAISSTGMYLSQLSVSTLLMIEGVSALMPPRLKNEWLVKLQRVFLSVVLKVMLFAFSLLKELASATFVFLPFFTLTEVFAAFTEERIFFSIFAAVLVSSRR